MAKQTKNTDVSGTKPEETIRVAQEAKRRPIQTLREGDVSASIRAREVQSQGKPVTFCSVSFERSYRDRAGTWKYTKNFDASDLGALVAVAQRAAEYIESLQHEAVD